MTVDLLGNIPRPLYLAPARRLPEPFLHTLDALLQAAGISRRARRSYSVCSAGGQTSSDRDPLPARIGRIIVYIDEHLDGPLSLDRLADEADLSKYHFSRVFRKEVGKTPWTYVREARVRRAKDLLEKGASPAEAAVDAGFFDQSHLTNVMKDVDGTTPKRYQRERRGGDRKDLQE